MTTSPEKIDDRALDQAVHFLEAIFRPGDSLSFRPIETWIEGGKKRSRVDHQEIAHYLVGSQDHAGNWHRVPDNCRDAVRRMMERSATERTNLFFGVCPRFAASEQYDLAWQIRTVRTLWADLGNCNTNEALARCEKAGLPRPSIIVNSGHGVHLYWLLDEPWLIDDAGDPLPVLTELIDGRRGKTLRKHVKDPQTSEKLYIDTKQYISQLSPKGLHIQDILAGIAAKTGGDHIQDLARLLRLPGSLNRKDQRNGKEPVPCALVECDSRRPYPIATFEPFAEHSPDRARRRRIAQVRLPSPRKLGPKKHDHYNELLTRCAAAQPGARSEADFALCCFAIEHGMSKAEVWADVREIGKFAEGGERCVDLTWANAEEAVREKLFEKAEGKYSGDAHRGKGKQAEGEAGEEEEGLVKFIGDSIQAVDHFAQDAGGRLYRYVDGVYRARADEYVKRRVKAICLRSGRAKFWGSGPAKEVVEFIRVDSPALWDRPPLDVLNLKNGLFRLADAALLPHSPDHLSAVQLPVEYDPEATCPAIEEFVSQVFPADANDLAWEIVAWLMRPDTSIQSAILLCGEGANGKSTFLRLVLAFLGTTNTAAVSLHKLEADIVAVARLIGKLANICPDLPSEHLAGTSVFKAITGGDMLSAEYKFKDSFDFMPFARLVFSANHPPRSADASPAFFRRWLVIPFDRTFSPNEQIPSDVLDARLSTPRELSGLLNKALAALPRLKRQRGFSEPESIRLAWADFYTTTDPLAIWLDKFAVDDPDAFVPQATLRAEYNAAAEREGRPALTKQAFGRAFAKLRPKASDAQRTVNGKVQWCYVGIGLHAEDATASRTSRDSREFLHSVTNRGHEA